MCNQEKAKIIIQKLNDILLSLRLQHSGADIHTVGNIRNTCSMLIQTLEDDPHSFPEDEANRILINQQNKLVDFFNTKYLAYRCGAF